MNAAIFTLVFASLLVGCGSRSACLTNFRDGGCGAQAPAPKRDIPCSPVQRAMRIGLAGTQYGKWGVRSQAKYEGFDCLNEQLRKLNRGAGTGGYLQ